MTVGRVACFVGHPRLKAMNRTLPCIWMQVEIYIWVSLYWFSHWSSRGKPFQRTGIFTDSAHPEKLNRPNGSLDKKCLTFSDQIWALL
jgi:hypothetical protein